MGQARKRGTREERIQQGIARRAEAASREVERQADLKRLRAEAEAAQREEHRLREEERARVNPEQPARPYRSGTGRRLALLSAITPALMLAGVGRVEKPS